MEVDFLTCSYHLVQQSSIDNAGGGTKRQTRLFPYINNTNATTPNHFHDECEVPELESSKRETSKANVKGTLDRQRPGYILLSV